MQQSISISHHNIRNKNEVEGAVCCFQMNICQQFFARKYSAKGGAYFTIKNQYIILPTCEAKSQTCDIFRFITEIKKASFSR